jgi:Bacterial mobilisation protein (MobC)
MMDFRASHPVPSAARGSARRHRVEGGRHCVVRVRFTDAELAAVEAREAESKVTVQRYLTGSALSRRPHPTTTAAPPALAAELAALRRLTANLANNINQIARWLNSGGSPDASIDPALAAVRRAMDRLDRALGAAHPASPGSPGPPAQSNPGRSP